MNSAKWLINAEDTLWGRRQELASEIWTGW